MRQGLSSLEKLQGLKFNQSYLIFDKRIKISIGLYKLTSSNISFSIFCFVLIHGWGVFLDEEEGGGGQNLFSAHFDSHRSRVSKPSRLDIDMLMASSRIMMDSKLKVQIDFACEILRFNTVGVFGFGHSDVALSMSVALTIWKALSIIRQFTTILSSHQPS